jgi:hypothetical protein
MARGVPVDEATGTGEVADLAEALRDLGSEARDTVSRLVREWELERRVQENPVAALGVAAAAGFVLGGGLWPLLRPFVKAAARTALSPANLLALGAAIGAMRAASATEPPPPEAAPPATH